LMVALARAGRPVEAMRSYERFRRRLADEVGVVPSRSLQRLNDDVLRQAPSTAWEYRAPDASAPAATVERLPRHVTSFVGRIDAVARLVEVMRARGLVTVCGPGGVGKTRLALEAARAYDTAERPPHGVWWCDLSAVAPEHHADGGDGVAHAVVAALGVGPEPGVATRDRILGFLAAKDLTLVIDNCEQVAPAVADLAASIVRCAPSVGVLATSREPLAIAGERVVVLDPLSDDDAVRLFVERAAAVRAGFGITPENASTVMEICRRLDGIPLAVELAAGRLGSLGVADLARLLDDRFRVLVTSRRDAPDRHRTVRAAIDSSYDALSPDERFVFDRLAVFPGSFDLEAGEVVCAYGSLTPADVPELLSHLVARSLLIAEPDARGAVRYRLLETLRAYAEERLAGRGDGATDLARRAHAEHYAALVTQAAAVITGADETRWVTWLATELPNLRAAVHWATARGDLDLATGLFTPLPIWTWCGTARSAEIGRWAVLLVRQPGIEQHPAYPGVCEWGCRGVIAAGEQVGIREWTARVTAPGFTPTPETLGFLANVMMPEDPHEAVAMYARAADMARERGDRFLEAALRSPTVRPGFSSHRPDNVEHTHQALAAARASGSPTAIAWALLGVATNLSSVDRDTALAAIDELPAVVSRCAFPDPTLRSASEYANACLQLAEGDLSGLGPLRALISGHLAIGQRRMLSVHLQDLAEVLVHLGTRLDIAVQLISGVRAQRLQFRPASERSAGLMRVRMGDGPYESAARRGADLTLEQLAEQAVATIDDLLPASA
jgi:predicted ATPase